MAPKITVHHLDNSRSTRVVWLLEELGLPYELKIYPRHAKTLRAPPELKKVHALGRSPVVHIEEDGETYNLAESGAIMDFILTNYSAGRLAPSRSDKKKRAEHDFYMHYAEAGPMFPTWARMAALRAIGDPKDPGVHAFLTPMVNEHLAYVEDILSKQPYFGGQEFSAADIAMAYTLLNLRSKRLPRVNEWLDRVTAREAYKRTIEKSGEVAVLAFSLGYSSQLRWHSQGLLQRRLEKSRSCSFKVRCIALAINCAVLKAASLVAASFRLLDLCHCTHRLDLMLQLATFMLASGFMNAR